MNLDLQKIQNAIQNMRKAVVENHNVALKNEGGVEVLTALLQGAFNVDPKPAEETQEETQEEATPTE